MQCNTKLSEIYWLNWHYSLTDNFDLSLANVFDKIAIDSENGPLVLHLKDGQASFKTRVKQWWSDRWR